MHRKIFLLPPYLGVECVQTWHQQMGYDIWPLPPKTQPGLIVRTAAGFGFPWGYILLLLLGWLDSQSNSYQEMLSESGEGFGGRSFFNSV